MRLQLADAFALSARQHRVARKEIGPAFESLRNIESRARTPVSSWAPRIWGEDVGPEFGAGKTPADIHHQPMDSRRSASAFSGKAEDHVERRPDARLREIVGGLIDGFDFLKILVHQCITLGEPLNRRPAQFVKARRAAAASVHPP